MRDRFSDAAPLLRVTYENRRGRETSRQREWSGSRATRKIPQAHAAPCVAALTGCRIGSVDVRGSFSALSRRGRSPGSPPDNAARAPQAAASARFLLLHFRSLRSSRHPHPHKRKQLVDVERLGEIIVRSEEHTSELQSLMRISYAVFCLKKKNIKNTIRYRTQII